MDLHQMANAGAVEWDRYCGKMLDEHEAEFLKVRDKMHISLVSNYDVLSAADRSAFAFTLEDYVRTGIPEKKKGRKR